jgi:hypothetical protein
MNPVRLKPDCINMPITYSYDAADHLIHTIVTGDAHIRAIEDYLDAISAEPWFPTPALVDTRQVATNLSSPEVRRVVEMLRRLGPRLNGMPIAVIVSSDVAFGLTRMIELMLDDVITIAPFRDIASARTWLSQSHVARATAALGGRGTDVSTNG